MEILQQLLQQHAPGLVSKLVERLGFAPDAAEQFVPAAANQLMNALGGGDLDLADLVRGADLSSLFGKMDLTSLAQTAGVGEDQARDGVQAIAPEMLSAIGDQAGGAKQLLGALGKESGDGLLGAAGKLADGFFKKD